MTPAADLGITTAGLDLVSGVFGYLAAQQAASVAKSRADIITEQAHLNAQRYSEQAASYEAHEEVMYLASGVKLAGSPVDALATSAQTAQFNINAILMAGQQEAQDQTVAAVNDQMKGRDALVGGFDKAAGAGIKGYAAGNGNTGLGVMADMLSKAGGNS